MVLTMMITKVCSKQWLTGAILFASVSSVFAQGMDAADRQDKMDMKRQGAETRIERIQQDQQGPRAQEKKFIKKSRKTKTQQRMQF